MAAKKTADLIPLAHPGIGVTGANVDVELFAGGGARVSNGNQRPNIQHAEMQDTTVDESEPGLSFAGNISSPPTDDTTTTTAATATATATSDVSAAPQSKFGGVSITATVECQGKTGVEMEAMTAASVAGLTMYDMCKGVDKGMVMQGLRVVKKTGGKSGDWVWDEGRGAVRQVGESSPAENVTKRQQEEVVRSRDERGSVDQERLETAWWRRRKMYERGTGGTVLDDESGERPINSSQMEQGSVPD